MSCRAKAARCGRRLCRRQGCATPDAAYKFLNYLLRPGPDVAAKTTELAQLATSVEASKEKLPADIVKNTAIFPPPESLAKADFILDLGPATKFYQDG